MGTTNNAYSDLIHLFIDGEATETERNLLFGALKDSPELQEEFSSAMQLKQAFASDIMRLQPPSYLQSKIAERAGLLIAASSSVATAPAVVNSVTSAINTVAPVAATGISKGLLALIIGTSVGVLSTIGVMQLTKESPQAVSPAMTTNISTERMAAPGANIPESSVSGMSAPVKNSENGLKGSTKASTFQTLRSAAPLPVLHFGKATVTNNSASIHEPGQAANSDRSVNNENARVASTENTPAMPEKTNAETVQNTNNPVTNSPVLTPENVIATSVMPQIASIDPVTPAVKNVGWATANHNPLYDGSEGYYNEPDWMARMSFSLRGMSTSKLFQGNDDMGKAPQWNNMAVSVKYEADIFSAFAIEAGQETFPIYLSNGNNGYDPHHSITWVGGSYTISNPLWKIMGIYPEARVLIGGAISAGLITKFSGGLVFQPSRQFSLSVDPEYTALFVNQNGTPTGGTKLGLTGSLIFHF